MAARRPPGSPGKIISFFRDILLGRPAMASPWLRRPSTISSRSQDPPSLPGGPAHRLAFNYYYSRDARRDVLPPTIISSFKPLPLIEEAANEGETSAEVSAVQTVSTTPPLPGTGHKWTSTN